ncbi:MAG TPA: hypothetical protein VHU61_12110 [Solirubrobacteraceae bacterium]|jgi:hypothetical protein|nr:hypothetical protein [Solirubrobacteraceae bacterium]
MPAELVLQSVVPLGAVPGRLRSAVAGVLEPWGYSWGEISFAGTAAQPAAAHRGLSLGPDQIWVFAVTTGSLALGDRLESAGSRAAGISLSAFSGGVIPVTPFQARVYEYLGGHGGDQPSPPRVPPGLATTPETERAAPDRLR